MASDVIGGVSYNATLSGFDFVFTARFAKPSASVGQPVPDAGGTFWLCALGAAALLVSRAVARLTSFSTARD